MSVPEKDPYAIRVMGIDPSTQNMGVFVIDVDTKVCRPFKLVYANTIYGEKTLFDIPLQFDDQLETGVLARSYGLARALGTLVDIYEPDTGICEDNFLGASAKTFKQLIQFVSLVRETFNKHNVHLSYVLPNLAKDIVGANFRGTQKEDVHDGLIAYNWLDAGEIDLTVLDEHSVDAGAVTLFRCEQIANQYKVFP